MKTKKKLEDEIFFSDEEEIPPKITRRNSYKRKKIKKTKNSKFHNLINLYKSEIRHAFKEKKYRNINNKDLMDQANLNYIQKNYENVKKDCNELILKNPNIPDPYNLLYLVYEDLGDLKKSTDFLLIKTKLEKRRDFSIWEELYKRYNKLKDFISTNYCLSRCLKFHPNSEILLLKKGECLEKMGKIKKSIIYFERFIELDPYNFDIIKKLGKLYLLMSKEDKALLILLKFVGNENFMQKPDFNILNVVCELLNKLKLYCVVFDLLFFFILDFSKYILLIEDVSKSIKQQDIKNYEPFNNKSDFYKKKNEFFSIFQNFPLEIRFQYLISFINCDFDEFKIIFEIIDKEEIYNNKDILKEFINNLFSSQKYFILNKEIDFFLKKENIKNEIKIFLLDKKARIYKKKNKRKKEIKFYLEILKINPDLYKYKLKISKYYKDKKKKKVLELLEDKKSNKNFDIDIDNISFISKDIDMISKNSDNEEIIKKEETSKFSSNILFKWKLTNPNCLEELKSEIKKINKNYKKDYFLLLFERIKLEDKNDKNFYKDIFNLLNKSLELEIHRIKFSDFLKNRLMTESINNLNLTLTNLSNLYNMNSMIQSDSKNLNLKENILEKKKFFTKKLCDYFQNDIFSVIYYIGIDNYLNYFNELLKYYYENEMFSEISFICKKFHIISENYLNDPILKIEFQFQWFVSNFNLKDYELCIFNLKEILKVFSNSKNVEYFQKDDFSYFSLLQNTIYHLNKLLHKIKTFKNSIISHLQKLLKKILNQISKEIPNEEKEEEQKIDLNQKNPEKNFFKISENELKNLKIIINSIIGNLYFINTSYDLAINFYNNILKLEVNNLLSYFMISICYINKTISRNNENPSDTFLKSFQYLNFICKQISKEEYLYNMARIFNQIGDFKNCVRIYENILNLDLENFDIIKYKSAFNLFAIYCKLKNPFMTEITKKKYLIF